MAIRRIDSWLRNLESSKLESYPLLKRVPAINDAREGVPMYVLLGGRLFKYIKFQRKLYKILIQDTNPQPSDTEIGDPEYIYDIKLMNYTKTSNADETFVPWYPGGNDVGSVAEDSTSNQYIAPYNGHLIKVMLSSSETQNGNCTVALKRFTGSSSITTTTLKSSTLDWDQSGESNITFNFTENGSPNNSISKKSRIGISINPNNTPNYIKVTAVFKWNINS